MKLSFTFICLFFISAMTWSQEATLVTFKGEVTLNKSKIEEGQKNLPINRGAALEAIGPNSFFIVQYKNGSRFMVKNGRIIVKELKADNTEVSLLTGTIFSYINPKAAQKFKVKTKRASFGVRGTKFWLQEDDKESYLCVCEGVVAVRNNHSLMLVNPREDSHIDSSLGTLQKSAANDMMWKMATEGFKTMGLPVSSTQD